MRKPPERGGAVDLVVKVGGAAITEKNKFEVVNEHILDATLDILVSELSNKRAILIHGAGSFGHPHVKSLRALPNSSESLPDRLIAASNVRRTVSHLNHRIVTSLISRGVPAVCVSPGNYPDSLDYMAITRSLVDSGYLPVLHGDISLLDQNRIISGDDIIVDVCRLFDHVGHAVFVTNVDAVYDRDPTLVGARPYKLIRTPLNGSGAFAGEERSYSDDIVLPHVVGDKRTDLLTATDVTGGMKGKVVAAMNAVIEQKGRLRVDVVGVNDQEEVLRALRKEPLMHGTIIVATSI